ncbi:MAG: hypothetical protein GC171_08425 [Terrimonas sp.]|nr:hypothetical protein [Terrimonas sp.]
MMHPAIRKAFFILALFSFMLPSQAQNPALPGSIPSTEKKAKKPYKILTSGKTITIKTASVNLKNLMIWTARGNRILELKDINRQQYSYTSTINENIFFILMEMDNGQRFTEKIGI